MKQINLQKIQNKLRNKFIKIGVKMIAPETIFFSEDTKIGKNVVIDTSRMISFQAYARGYWRTRESTLYIRAVVKGASPRAATE